MARFQRITDIKVQGKDGVERCITLALGDLARIDPAEGVDLLVVSALPNDYTPTPNSLIGQLAREGVHVAELATMKARDLRETTGAWLSVPLDGVGFRRLVCFEPEMLGAPPKVVGQVFRALFPFLDEGADQVVAMPLIAAGNAGWSVEEMTAPLVDAAMGWLQLGLPVSELVVVERSESKIAEMRAVFEARRKKVFATQNAGFGAVGQRRSTAMVTELLTYGKVQPVRPYRVFLSFSSHDADAADRVVARFSEIAPNVEVFDFRRDVPIGLTYQRQIDDALERSDKLLCLLSPDYMASPECEVELMVARLRNKRSGFEFLWPVYWRDVPGDLADWIMILNLADCREGDTTRLDASIERIVSEL